MKHHAHTRRGAALILGLAFPALAGAGEIPPAVVVSNALAHSYSLRLAAKEVDAEIQQVAGKFGLAVDRWLSLLESERNVDPQQYRRRRKCRQHMS